MSTVEQRVEPTPKEDRVIQQLDAQEADVADDVQEAEVRMMSPRKDSKDTQPQQQQQQQPLLANPVMREFQIKLPFPGNNRLHCNPITSVLALLMLVGLAAWCMSDPSGTYVQLIDIRDSLTRNFSWFIIGSNPAMMLFLVYVVYYFGDQKLGPPDSRPEFDALSYFAMIFSAGVAVGLFFYAVSEPLYHLYDNRFAATGFHSEDEKKTYAVFLTVYHWGLSGWTVYVLTGVTAGIVAYRDGYPMTMRSCFYPLLGEHTWGVLGDIIDAVSIVVVIAGVCTDLGLGAIQLVAGINRQTGLGLEPGSNEENVWRIATIWVVTAAATVSVVSGLDLGIKILSQLALFMGLLLWFLVLMFDETAYLLNILVASVGYYFQHGIFEVNFETDAFAQLRQGEGRSVDGLSAYSTWMADWTAFYWAWWAAWASFVGLFIARISRGRTIREVVVYTLGAPMIYTFLWFSVFGGAGIRMHSRAFELIQLGTELGDPALFRVNATADAGEECYSFLEAAHLVGDGYLAENGWTEVERQAGIQPVCLGISDISWWQVMEQYYGFGTFLSWLALGAIAIYFVTSSDSGSLIVDHLASNGGDEEGHSLQRVFWSCMQGATATGLLVAGKAEALSALQAAVIIAGLPFRILLVLMCTSLYRLCNNYKGAEHRQFAMPVYAGAFGLLEMLAAGLSGGQLITRKPSARSLLEALIGLVAPWRGVLVATGNRRVAAVVGVFHLATVVIFAASASVEGAAGFAWAAYIVFTGVMSYARFEFRTARGIYGNVAEDFFCCLFLWFQVSAQLVIEAEQEETEESVLGEKEEEMEMEVDEAVKVQ